MAITRWHTSTYCYVKASYPLSDALDLNKPRLSTLGTEETKPRDAVSDRDPALRGVFVAADTAFLSVDNRRVLHAEDDRTGDGGSPGLSRLKTAQVWLLSGQSRWAFRAWAIIPGR